MNWNAFIDELRLIYAERRDHLSTLERVGKRSKEELDSKRQRLALLKEGGVALAAELPSIMARQDQ